MQNIELQIKNVDRGYATNRNGHYQIIIPAWANHISDDYLTYYICHECAHITCHALYGTFRHTAEFKAIENMYLADFGLSIVRKKVYPKTITAFGQVVYSSLGFRFTR